MNSRDGMYLDTEQESFLTFQRRRHWSYFLCIGYVGFCVEQDKYLTTNLPTDQGKTVPVN